jgi:hypothetical protein
MIIFQTILILIVTYVTLRSIIPFLIFPGYLFTPKIKKSLSLEKVSMKLRGKTKEQTLKNAFNFVVSHHFGIAGTIKKVFLIRNAFLNNPESILGKKIPLYCHNSNLLLRCLLVNAGLVSEEDIVTKWSFGSDMGIHQYLLININKKLFKLDPFYNIFQEIK